MITHFQETWKIQSKVNIQFYYILKLFFYVGELGFLVGRFFPNQLHRLKTPILTYFSQQFLSYQGSVTLKTLLTERGALHASVPTPVVAAFGAGTGKTYSEGFNECNTVTPTVASEIHFVPINRQ